MADQAERARTWMESTPFDADGGGYLAQLGHLLVPGHKDPVIHLLEMSRLSREKARNTVVLLNEHFRTSKRWTNYPKDGIDWWGLDEGARLGMLTCAASNSLDGAGRADLVAVLMGALRVIRSRGKRLLSRGDEGSFA